MCMYVCMADLLTDLVALAVPLVDRQQQPLGCVHAGMLKAGIGDGGDLFSKGDLVFFWEIRFFWGKI